VKQEVPKALGAPQRQKEGERATETELRTRHVARGESRLKRRGCSGIKSPRGKARLGPAGFVQWRRGVGGHDACRRAQERKRKRKIGFASKSGARRLCLSDPWLVERRRCPVDVVMRCVWCRMGRGDGAGWSGGGLKADGAGAVQSVNLFVCLWLMPEITLALPARQSATAQHSTFMHYGERWRCTRAGGLRQGVRTWTEMVCGARATQRSRRATAMSRPVVPAMTIFRGQTAFRR